MSETDRRKAALAECEIMLRRLRRLLPMPNDHIAFDGTLDLLLFKAQERVESLLGNVARVVAEYDAEDFGKAEVREYDRAKLVKMFGEDVVRNLVVREAVPCPIADEISRAIGDEVIHGAEPESKPVKSVMWDLKSSEGPTISLAELEAAEKIDPKPVKFREFT